MIKEVLTKENIERDVVAYVNYKNSLITDSFMSFFIPITFLAILGAVAFGMLSLPLAAVAVFIPSVCLLLWYILVLRRGFIVKEAVLADGYAVTKEPLISIVEETYVEPHVKHGRGRVLRDAKVMYFGVGSWRIPSRVYEWSDTFSMSAQGVENTSVAGNEFYVVTLKSTGDIVCVYNTKFFDR